MHGARLIVAVLVLLAMGVEVVAAQPAAPLTVRSAMPPVREVQKTTLFFLDEVRGTIRAREERTLLSETSGGGTKVLREWLSGEAPSQARAGNGSCSLEGDANNVTSYPPQRVGYDDGNVAMHWTYFLHMKYKAAFREGSLQKQLQMCGAGGSKAYGGFRTRTSGTTMTYRAQPVRIDGSHAQGRDATRLTTSLGFRVGLNNGPLRVDGRITIAGGGRNHGGPGRTDIVTPDDAFPFNQWHGLWDSNCIIEATIFCGSHDFEGTLVHDLWEFENEAPLNAQPASATAFLTYSCGRVFGMGCGPRWP